MAAFPVVIDCGGSTRIKQLPNGGPPTSNMDGLIGPPFVSIAAGTFPANFGLPAIPASAKVRVSWVDVNGAPGATASQTMGGGDSVQISSAYGHAATMSLDGATGTITLSLTGPTGIPPLVDAREVGSVRRYEVANAGAITNVVVNSGGVQTNLFPIAGLQAIYVSVHVK